MKNVDEPARLACPRCELVYRLKKVTPGKRYACRTCGGPLVPADAVAAGEGGRTAVMTSGFLGAYDNSADVASGRAGVDAGLSPESGLSRLPKLIEQLTERLDAMRELELADDESGPAAELVRMSGRIEEDLRRFSDAVGARLAELDEKVSGEIAPGIRDMGGELKREIAALDEKVSAALDGSARTLHDDINAGMGGLDSKLGELDSRLSALYERFAATGTVDDVGRVLAERHEQLVACLDEYLEAQKRELNEHRETQKRELDDFRDRHRRALDEHRETQKREIDAFLAKGEEARNATTVEVDIDDLADRLVAGVRGYGTPLDSETESAMQAVARLAEELVKEQGTNTESLERLAEEIRGATANIAKLDEWQGGLPDHIADDIGRTVGARVVEPVSEALARQAPAILSDFQDNKLVDIVSRSVREAQRPLLREILAGGRGGVPVWLFASILLPLLLVLGYLFLPGEFGGPERGASPEVAESLARIESGMSLVADSEERLGSVEKVVLDIHNKALEHARNAAILEDRVGQLSAAVAERDKRIEEYDKKLSEQAKLVRQYERRLMQEGIVPGAAGE